MFGRDLGTVVKQTAVEMEQNGGNTEANMEREQVYWDDLKALEERLLPAIVVRCAQHLLI